MTVVSSWGWMIARVWAGECAVDMSLTAFKSKKWDSIRKLLLVPEGVIAIGIAIAIVMVVVIVAS